LKLKWAYGFSGDMTSFAAPTVMGGTLFMGSAGGMVQGINASTGCLYWVLFTFLRHDGMAPESRTRGLFSSFVYVHWHLCRTAHSS
jgi:outer membrane protein assembly factor BamB